MLTKPYSVMPASTEKSAVTKDLHVQIVKVVARVSDPLRARDFAFTNRSQQRVVHHAMMKRSRDQGLLLRKNSKTTDVLRLKFVH